MHNSTKLTYFDKIMTAITFAEAGEMETAKNVLDSTTRKRKQTEKVPEKRPSLRLE